MPSRLKTCDLSDNMLSFHVGGKIIEVVNEWPHLGHIISTTLLDGADITSRKNKLIGQINNVLCYFGKLDSVIKVKLLKSYWSIFMGVSCGICGIKGFKFL